MIGLKEACKNVLRKCPNEYVHCVNEYKDAYQFILVTKGCDVTDMGGTLWSPAVIKETGEVLENACMFDEIFDGDYKQYTKSDIERL